MSSSSTNEDDEDFESNALRSELSFPADGKHTELKQQQDDFIAAARECIEEGRVVRPTQAQALQLASIFIEWFNKSWKSELAQPLEQVTPAEDVININEFDQPALDGDDLEDDGEAGVRSPNGPAEEVPDESADVEMQPADDSAGEGSPKQVIIPSSSSLTSPFYSGLFTESMIILVLLVCVQRSGEIS